MKILGIASGVAVAVAADVAAAVAVVTGTGVVVAGAFADCEVVEPVVIVVIAATEVVGSGTCLSSCRTVVLAGQGCPLA